MFKHLLLTLSFLILTTANCWGAFPTTGLLDQFNRANEDPVTGWTGFRSEPVGKIVSQQLVVSNVLTGATQYFGASTYTDCECYFTMVTAPTTDCSLYVRIDGGDGDSLNGYRVIYSVAASTVKIQKYVAGTRSDLATISSVTFANGDSFGISIVSTTIRAYKKTSGTWAELGNVVDSTFTSAGYIGMRGGADATWVFDNFGGGTVVSGTYWGPWLDEENE
jgi:hypothetical protein